RGAAPGVAAHARAPHPGDARPARPRPPRPLGLPAPRAGLSGMALEEAAGGGGGAAGGRLLRLLGLGFGLAVIIRNTIGAGIVRTPGEIAAGVTDPRLYLGVWIAGGLYALLGANAIAELGAAIPRSGGQYAFSRRALGDYAGFLVGFSDWLSTCGSAAAVALVLAEYLGALI